MKRNVIKKKNKYNNRKVEYNGILFDSKKEMERYVFLKKAESEGKISGLTMQKKYELVPAVKEIYEIQLKTKTKTKERTLQLPITYKSDFEYIKDGEIVTEDVKASKFLIPKEFSIKSKLFFWQFGRKIRLIFDPNESI